MGIFNDIQNNIYMNDIDEGIMISLDVDTYHKLVLQMVSQGCPTPGIVQIIENKKVKTIKWPEQAIFNGRVFVPGLDAGASIHLSFGTTKMENKDND